MENIDLSRQLIEMYWNSAVFVAVPMVIGSIAALFVALFQAMTQISEQTLPQTVKIAAIGLVLLIFGSTLAQPIYRGSEQLFNDFALSSAP